MTHYRTVSKLSQLSRWLLLVLCLFLACVAESAEKKVDASTLFMALIHGEELTVDEALEGIESTWHPGYTPMGLEVLRLSRNPQVGILLLTIMADKTGQTFGYDIEKWQEWLWNEPEQRHPDYARFKARLYSLLDPRFAHYFHDEPTPKIRLDEIVWGGVLQDGIPPLRQPNMLAAKDAAYLADDNVVFGLEVNGDPRAYPKRIMAWHEMFVDTVGGVRVAGVYCTLCGSMILYKTEVDGTNHEVGTSGFLYRSNKLMYDKATQSLWNTIWGNPVVGPLANQAFALDRLSIVTTTWGEWRRRHPNTQVLSLDTGHSRDYSEGEAYRSYFATDELMFNVPKKDTRLKNKTEVLGLVFAQHPDKPLAISADYLLNHPVYHDRVGNLPFVVFTDRSGANRVYQAPDVQFISWNQDATATDSDGKLWTLTESTLTSGARRLYRLPAHRAFWFGWYSAYNHTRLVDGSS